MEIVTWKKNKENRESGVIVRVNKEEAYRIIKSLAAQMQHKSPITGREEFITDKSEYFSIAVHDD